MPSPKQWAASSARIKMYEGVRRALVAKGFAEVETPALVPAPGMEPHITAFEVPFIPETSVGGRRTLYLHTSPEYAMKRLLADGCGPVFQICKVFRNGEISQAHNPEFTLLEMYRPGADYRGMMADLEDALAVGTEKVGPEQPFRNRPFEQLTVRDAFLRYAEIDLAQCASAEKLRLAALAAGARVGDAVTFEDLFFHVFLQRVEPRLGLERPTFLIDYPASMASLARLKPGDSTVAERFELYVQGSELANGFSELTDAKEQRRRLLDEQAQRSGAGKPAYPLDERFLEAVGRMPACAGVAVGLDRVLMLLLGARAISDVLLFPAEEFV